MTIRNIAVLGTSSGVATTITAKLRSNPSNAVRILSRSPRPNRENVRVVDYGSVSSLSKALEGVDTIVSFLAIYDYDEDIRVNENVIEAAKAVGVKRFIPCEYIAGDQCNIKIKALKSKPEIRKLAAASGLEYTFIHNGYFTNYFAQGSPKNKDGEGMSGLPGYSLNIDLEKKTARVTGTGDEKIVFTRLEDVASAVAGLVESDEKWNPDSWVVGDSKSWNEVLDLAKKISGLKLEEHHVSLEELRKEKEKTADPSMTLEFDICEAEGLIQPSSDAKVINPDGAVGVEDFMKRWWS